MTLFESFPHEEKAKYVDQFYDEGMENWLAEKPMSTLTALLTRASESYARLRQDESELFRCSLSDAFDEVRTLIQDMTKLTPPPCKVEYFDDAFGWDGQYYSEEKLIAVTREAFFPYAMLMAVLAHEYAHHLLHTAFDIPKPYSIAWRYYGLLDEGLAFTLERKVAEQLTEKYDCDAFKEVTTGILIEDMVVTKALSQDSERIQIPLVYEGVDLEFLSFFASQTPGISLPSHSTYPSTYSSGLAKSIHLPMLPFNGSRFSPKHSVANTLFALLEEEYGANLFQKILHGEFQWPPGSNNARARW